jgi:Fis family transcriptional regulator
MQLQQAAWDFAQTQIETGKTDKLFQNFKETVEAPYLEKIMDAHQGNQAAAARALGINRATLRMKLKRYGLI